MKHSLRPTRARNAAVRLTLLVLPVILCCGAAIVSAQQNSLVGQWRTNVPPSTLQGVPIAGGTITISIMASGQYDQTSQSTTAGSTAMMQAGPYQLVAPNSIIFRVTTYSPTTRIILVPCGIPGDPVCNRQQVENLPKPPDSQYVYTFNGPNTLMLKNQAGSYTFTRVAGQ